MHTYSGKLATKDTLQKAFADFATKVKPEDNFAVILIGHGTFDSFEYKFNIPGPDLTATELSQWLDKIPATRQLIVITTSAAGASVRGSGAPRFTHSMRSFTSAGSSACFGGICRSLSQ